MLYSCHAHTVDVVFLLRSCSCCCYIVIMYLSLLLYPIHIPVAAIIFSSLTCCCCYLLLPYRCHVPVAAIIFLLCFCCCCLCCFVSVVDRTLCILQSFSSIHVRLKILHSLEGSICFSGCWNRTEKSDCNIFCRMRSLLQHFATRLLLIFIHTGEYFMNNNPLYGVMIR